jgi:hypothetical protein
MTSFAGRPESMTLAPEAPLLPPPPPSPRVLRKRVVAATVVIGVVCVWTVLNFGAVRHWYQNVTADDTGPMYPSSRFMAEHVGCLDTFRPAAMPGTSATSGECNLPNGAHVEFRTFNTPYESFAWADGAWGQSGKLEEAGAGGVGYNWAIRVTGTTDPSALNAIFSSLPE